jgi:small subunit ribosomal protein S20
LANHKSAAKRARQTIKKTAVNNKARNSVRTFEKNLVKAITEKNVKAIPELLKDFTAKIYKAAAKGLMKKETASRKVSRLSKKASETVKA